MSAEVYFVDTSFLIAHRNNHDENHLAAVACYDALKHNLPHLKLIVTDYIFDEFATLLISRLNKQQSVDICNELLNDPLIRLLAINPEYFHAAWKIFEKMLDKNWSFTDCTSYVIMQALGIDHGLAFDHHFKQFGFAILP